jgi:hypothetical protein
MVGVTTVETVIESDPLITGVAEQSNLHKDIYWAHLVGDNQRLVVHFDHLQNPVVFGVKLVDSRTVLMNLNPVRRPNLFLFTRPSPVPHKSR